jgi:hypothetical protein
MTEDMMAGKRMNFDWFSHNGNVAEEVAPILHFTRILNFVTNTIKSARISAQFSPD